MQLIHAVDGYGKLAASRLSAYRSKSLAGVWCSLAVVMVSVGWLLPNHAAPWLTFHSDAWMAVALTIVATVVLVKRQRATLSWIDLLLACVAILPLVQFWIGLVPFAGRAWISTAYLVGFLAAVIVGRHWHAWHPRLMGDMLFASFFIASLVSVGLQMYQWLGMAVERDIEDIWVIGITQNRPFANLGQPNQLATLLLWGLLACAWARVRNHIGTGVAAAAATMLILGLAFTQSRTGFLGLLVMVAAAWCWRARCTSPSMPIWVTALVPLYFICTYAIGEVGRLLLLEHTGSMLGRTMSEVRPAVWAMFWDAAMQRPWLGYGWNEALAAHLAVTERHASLPTLFGHSHNLFLDLVIWTGFPLGIALGAACVTWVFVAARRVGNLEDLLYLLVVLTIGVHAMLELPYHYAYFLLPTGLAVGALSGQLKLWPLGPPTRAGWVSAVCVLAGAILLLALILRDYVAVEAAYVNARMKIARIGNGSDISLSRVLVLTQFPPSLTASTFQPVVGQRMEELIEARDVATSTITFRTMSKLTLALALNGYSPEARCWMAKAATMLSPMEVEMLRSDWALFQRAHPHLMKVQWPTDGDFKTACNGLGRSRLGPWPQLRWQSAAD